MKKTKEAGSLAAAHQPGSLAGGDALSPPAEGGSYVVKDGVRTRVEEATREAIAGDGVGGAAIGGDGQRDGKE